MVRAEASPAAAAPGLDAGEIEARLARRRPSCVDYRIEYRSSVSSTSDVVGVLGAEGLREGVVLLAAEQRRGIGQDRRRWHSRTQDGGRAEEPAATGNVTLAVVLDEAPDPGRFALERMAAALSVIEALRRVAGDPELPVRFRGPNDVYSYHPDPARGVPYRKIAGILAASEHCPEAVAALAAIPAVKPPGLQVMGVGINLRHSLLSNPLEQDGRTLAAVATSLEDLTGVRHPPEPVIAAFLERFDGNLAAVRRQPPEGGFLARVADCLARDGEGRITVELVGDPRGRRRTGRVLEVTPAGLAVVMDGAERVIPFAEVARFYPWGRGPE